MFIDARRIKNINKLKCRIRERRAIEFTSTTELNRLNALTWRKFWKTVNEKHVRQLRVVYIVAQYTKYNTPDGFCCCAV